ncbi:hypothetical protein [Leptospira sp. GIMC2001]|uniref:hypothetical protein n=1 Tax=Leptospira sp. GIMC2001 TaxID=1513297 RepID=UPI00234B0023|nr:hypothetical protein [Leptospira sp. GIMC2001]WCL50823.1 hypothetical protein O4O04_08425 [Leptospira sp. GIMC2001]
MNAYLLNWNPEHFDWEAADLAGDIQTVSETGSLKMRWSCGKLKRIVKGDRIFLIRLGVEPKGIVASGYAWSQPYEDTTWNDPQKKALYIEINFDRILDAETNDILRLDYLKKIPYHWTIQTAASIPNNVLKNLEDSWAEISQSPTLYPNEVIDDKSIFEGTFEPNPI